MRPFTFAIELHTILRYLIEGALERLMTEELEA